MTSTDPTGAEDYLAYAQGGDAAALERALRACADRAYTQARRHLGNAADADDAVQEAFLQLARTARRFDGSVPFAAWVGRLVQVACLRIRRSDRQRKRREHIAMAMPRPTPEPDDLHEQVRALVARLPEADRAVIDLHYFAGLPQAEVAAALGSSENTVAQRLSRARNRLSTLLGRREMGVAVVASLLAAQPAYAAPPHVAAGISTLTAAVATGSTLPATTIPLSLSQKGLLLMSLHPVASLACAGLLLLAGLLPAVLWGADPPPKPAPPPVVPAAGDQAWRGKARELLPFIDPAAATRAAVDWEFLRRQADTVKPASLLADPRAQPALAHIREQARLWALGGYAADWTKLLAGADGAVISLTSLPEARLCLVMELGRGAPDMQGWVAALNPGRPAVAVGPFSGIDLNIGLGAMQAGGRWACAHPDALQAGLGRRAGQPPPASVWAQVAWADAFAKLATLDSDRSDPLGLTGWFGAEWRTFKPILTATVATQGDHWRTTTVLDGISKLPLRPATPAIAGCVPHGALASLVLGSEPARVAAMFKPFIDPQMLRPLAAAGVQPERLLDWLSGDAAVVVQAQAPIPAFTLVLGLRPDAAQAVRQTIDGLAGRCGLAASPATGAIAAWGGATPAGMLQIQLAADRLVVSTGEAGAFLSPPARRISEAVVIDIDLPTLARSYLPMLLAQVPAKPVYFRDVTRLFQVQRDLTWFTQSVRRNASGGPPVDLDAWTDNEATRGQSGIAMSLGRVRTNWKQLTGRDDKPLNAHVAVYGKALDRHLVVLRRTDGWWLLTDNPYNIERFSDLAALETRLAGSTRLAGTAPNQLQVLDLPEQPSFDRRWLPPPEVIAAHLPRYRFALQTTPTGLRLEEDGLPLTALPGIIGAMRLEGSLSHLHAAAVLRRDGPSLKATHERAIIALGKAFRAMSNRDHSQPALLRASQMLAAAQVPLEELASLTGGTPPTAEGIDQLGFWRPSNWPHDNYTWLIPLSGGVFLEAAWWNQGAALTADPRTEQRRLSHEEMVEYMRKRDGLSPRLEQPTPDKPADF